jgi:hypothetical protein
VGSLNADNAILMFAFTGTNTGRNWDIRVSQIECSNPSRYRNSTFEKIFFPQPEKVAFAKTKAVYFLF